VTKAGPRRVALLPWGDVIEDYLDGIGLSFEDFRTKMTGGWLFGYAEALVRVGAEPVIVCVSASTSRPYRTTHLPTGVAMRVLPAPGPYRLARRARSRFASAPGPVGGAVRPEQASGRRQRGWGIRLAQQVAPWLATPYRALLRELRGGSYTAILCQEYENPRFDACVLIGRSLALPVFATFQGATWQTSLLERATRPATLRACQGLIIAPGVEARRVREQYGIDPARIHRIFNPIDTALWYPERDGAARDELGVPRNARVVVWHGRVEMEPKGLDVLLDAWSRVCRSRRSRDLRLVLVGTGRDSPALRAALAARALPGVQWRDEYVLDRPLARRCLSAADVYVFPSRREGFAVAPLEAMACGLPVVAAAAPGIPDIFEEGTAHGGIVVSTGDAGALAHALGDLLDDPERGELLGARARQRVESAFSFDAVGRQLHELLIGESAPGPPAAAPSVPTFGGLVS